MFTFCYVTERDFIFQHFNTYIHCFNLKKESYSSTFAVIQDENLSRHAWNYIQFMNNVAIYRLLNIHCVEKR